MLQSKLFSKTIKEIPKDEKSLNAQLLIKAGFVDKLTAGVYSLLPLGWRVMKKIEKIIRKEMENIDGQEIFMPALQPKENWQKTGRWDSLDILYKLKMENKEMALGPTHEEVISPLAKKTINSYKDLPKYVFQFQNKFRNEKRAKSGLLRGREFLMKDLYSFHKSEEDLDQYYEKVKGAYKKIFLRCGIEKKTFLTYASGGSFAKYSHEFQTLAEAGEDLIYICEKCQVAINKEILEDQKGRCPICNNEKLKEAKAIEVGNIFKLKDKFSQPFGLNYLDEKGDKKNVLMGCYGIGLQRLMGTIVEIFNDERGIIWPVEVTPFKVHLISLCQEENNPVYKKSKEIYQKLLDNKIEVLWDERSGLRAGEKFAEADLIGCTYRLVVSEKTLAENKIEVKKRNEKEVKLIEGKEILEVI